MKYIFIIYNPGYAGNFLQRLFSLGNDVSPVMPVDACNDKTFPKNIDERLALYSFKNVRNDFINWQKFHRKWVDFQSKDMLVDQVTNNNIIFSIHYPEFFSERQQVDQLENKELYCVDLDLNRYGEWIEKAKSDLNFHYRLDEQLLYTQLSNTIPLEKHINLTDMLDSEILFLKEYERICSEMKISLYPDHALTLYKEWYDTRVAYYF